MVVLSLKEKFVGYSIMIIIIGVVLSLIIYNLPEGNLSGNVVKNRNNYNLESKSIQKENLEYNNNNIKVNLPKNIPEDYCGDGYCDIGEDCSTCSTDCGDCFKTNFCGDGYCDIGECSSCFSDCSFIECENELCESSKGEDCINAPNDCRCNIGYVCDIETKDCVYAEQKTEVLQDKEESIAQESSDENYPIIFVHGHSVTSSETAGYSLNTFNLIESKLISDGIAAKGRTVYPHKFLEKVFYANKGKHVTFVTTYYTGISSLSNVYIKDEDTKSISVYGSRLTEVIKEVKKATNKNKVIIVAHSMGGLVAREHIRQTNGENVDKLIMIGTPNHGIWNRDRLGLTSLCASSLGHPGQECDDLHHDSVFLTELNKQETIGNVKTYTIAGSCGKSDWSGHVWDNIVRVKSVELNSAEENYVESCNNQNQYSLSNSFHSAMLNPNIAEAVYNKIVQFVS